MKNCQLKSRTTRSCRGRETYLVGMSEIRWIAAAGLALDREGEGKRGEEATAGKTDMQKDRLIEAKAGLESRRTDMELCRLREVSDAADDQRDSVEGSRVCGECDCKHSVGSQARPCLW